MIAMSPAQFIQSPFGMGLTIGLAIALFLFFQWWKAKVEISRLRRHLHDRMEIEADAVRLIKKDRDLLRNESENLRVKVASQNQLPDRRIERELEIYARAEKRMLVGVPGFAPAWEKAKAEAAVELAEEEAGRSIPQRVFNKLFGTTTKLQALPESSSTNPL